MRTDKRKAKKASARLSSNGYLRLSSDLVPETARNKELRFQLTPLPEKRTLVLRIVNNVENHLAKRKALYSNAKSICPIISVRAAMKFMGIKLPRKSRLFPVSKQKNELLVQF